MAVYYGHFSAMPLNFRPPRAGSMPERRQPIPIGPAEIDEARARRSGQSTGVPLRAAGQTAGGAR